MVEAMAIFGKEWLLGVLVCRFIKFAFSEKITSTMNISISPLVSSSGSSFCVKRSLFLLLQLGAVLVEKLEQLSSSVLESVRELGDGRWDLETLIH